MRHRLLTTCLLLAASAAACENPSGSKTGAPARLDVVSGNGQEAAAGQRLPQPVVVRVSDARGHPVRGQIVNFVVTAGGGSVFAGSALTSDDGIAQELWTVGTAAGSAQTLEVRAVDPVSGQPLVFATFTATVKPGPAASLTAVGGDVSVTGAPGAAVADSMVVAVADAYGNPVPGAQVAWAATAGGGSFNPPTTATDAQGRARGAWTLGTQAGASQTAQASIPGAAPVTFTANVATSMTKVSGDNRTLGTGEAVDLAVRLSNASGAVPGVPVTWQVAGGGGTVAPTQASAEPGVATARWTLGAQTGTQTLTATAGTLQVTFTATAVTSTGRTLVAQVPGRILDATADRVMWLDSAGSTRVIYVRTAATGQDALVMSGTWAAYLPVRGYLFTGGALVTAGSDVYEWRGAGAARVGTASQWYISVKENWAAWVGEGQVVRRDLAAGTSTVVYTGYPQSAQVGSNGDVAYIGGGVNFYSGGTTTPVSVETNDFPAGSVVAVETDGGNVGYFVESSAFAHVRLLLDRPGGDERLVASSYLHGGMLLQRFAGQWIAYGTQQTVYRRTPGGTIERLDSDALPGQLRALSPDGTVVYRANGSSRYVVVTAAGARSDAGAAGFDDRVVWHDGHFILISGSAAYRLG